MTTAQRVRTSVTSASNVLSVVPQKQLAVHERVATRGLLKPLVAQPITDHRLRGEGCVEGCQYIED